MLALERVPQSMDEPVQGAEGELGAFGELLADPLAADAYEQLLDHSEIEQIRALLGSLNERERMILRARYGLDGPEQSLRDVGERIGLSGERVRQIEQRALGKLRAAANRGDRDRQRSRRVSTRRPGGLLSEGASATRLEVNLTCTYSIVLISRA